jgi:hypothetical protein
MRKLSLFLGLASLLFSVACGGGDSGGGGVPVGPGSFSNVSLNGQYTYQISGADYTNGVFFREIGSFTADGKGHITAGEDDLSNPAYCANACLDTLTGLYSINQDGIGSISMVFDNTGGFTTDFFITMVTPSKLYLVPTDNGTGFPLSGYGVGEKQTASAFSSIPNGTFTFQAHDDTATEAYASVGSMTVSGGGINGTADILRSGVHTAGVAITGFLTLPDSNGRGTGAFIDAVNGTSSFAYYVVDANNLRMMSIDTGVLGLGRAEMQSGGPFALASFSGNYAFGSRGDDAFYSGGGVNTVGVFNSDGLGNISLGNYDTSVDGAIGTNLSYTGSYTMPTTAGRYVVTRTNGANQYYWMVNPSRLFLLTNDPNMVEDGTMDKQTVSPFSASTMNAQFGLLMDGFDDNNNLFDRVGTLKWDGTSVLTLNDIFNVGGVLDNSGILKGTYAVSPNGRATGTVGTSNLTFYLVSGSNAYVLQTNDFTGIIGPMSAQPAP